DRAARYRVQAPATDARCARTAGNVDTARAPGVRLHRAGAHEQANGLRSRYYRTDDKSTSAQDIRKTGRPDDYRPRLARRTLGNSVRAGRRRPELVREVACLTFLHLL